MWLSLAIDGGPREHEDEPQRAEIYHTQAWAMHDHGLKHPSSISDPIAVSRASDARARDVSSNVGDGSSRRCCTS
ncbi:hypothetical protein TKK_0000760 [Trichogramma kaykai]